MKKSDIRPLPEYFDRYINLVEDVELDEAFETGINWKSEMSVLAMGFTIVGHQKRHFDSIQEKYLTLAHNFKLI